MSKPVALVTGAANGIGRRLALQLARDGYAVAGIDLSPDGLQTLADQWLLEHQRGAVAVADVTDADQLHRQVTHLEQQLGPVDLLVANAGVGFETSALRYNAEAVQRILAVNLVGVSNSIAAVLPGMLERRRGHLVAMSSVASFRGLPRMWAYSASKAGVNALMEGIRIEVKGRGIDVTTICPGWIRTNMTAPVHDKLPDILELDDAVNRILYAIRTRRVLYAFPRKIVWHLRFMRWLPMSWQDVLMRKMMGRVRNLD